jgi:hypothetical protein
VHSVIGPHTARIVVTGRPHPQQVERSVAYTWRLDGITEVVVVHTADDDTTPQP